jgi:alpha-L-fucosidase
VDNSDKHRAGEMCQVLNDHWGYAAADRNYKPINELIENLVDCRKFNCNFLLNTGLLGNGAVNPIEACMLREIGKWVRSNKGFIYGIRASEIKAENADILVGEDCYYAVIKHVPMNADKNVQRLQSIMPKVSVDAEIVSAEWLDNGVAIDVQDNAFYAMPFGYGESGCVRVAKLQLR